MGHGYREPLCSTAAENLAVAEVRQHVSSCFGCTGGCCCRSGSWKPRTNGPGDDWRSSACAWPAAAAACALGGLEVVSPSLDLLSRETRVERGTLCLRLVVCPRKKMLKAARFQDKLCTQQVSLGRGSQAECCGHEHGEVGRFFRKADFRCPGQTRVEHLGLGHSACTGGRAAETCPSPQSCLLG